MKKSKFQKWQDKIQPNTNYSYNDGYGQGSKDAWNAACKSILKSIQYKNRMFEGNWQHEDINFLMEDIKDMIEK
jgi:hypothetical protein